MAYQNHAGALWRWRTASELAVDQELKARFREQVQSITRPYMQNLVPVDPAVRAYLLSISDEEIAS